MPSARKKPLDRQVVVITGASSGIGLATARLAARRGARVVLASRHGEALAEICRGIEREGGEAVHVATSPHDFKLLVSSDGLRSTSVESLATDEPQEPGDAADNGAQPSVSGAPGV